MTEQDAFNRAVWLAETFCPSRHRLAELAAHKALLDAITGRDLEKVARLLERARHMKLSSPFWRRWAGEFLDAVQDAGQSNGIIAAKRAA